VILQKKNVLHKKYVDENPVMLQTIKTLPNRVVNFGIIDTSLYSS